jgi:ABC-type multidrug transport system fused ATPase/permease subunit
VGQKIGLDLRKKLFGNILNQVRLPDLLHQLTGEGTEEGHDFTTEMLEPRTKRIRLSVSVFEYFQDLEFFDRNQTGELANRLSTDVHEVAEHLVENVAQLLHAVVR